jgi:hypothetical protein
MPEYGPEPGGDVTGGFGRSGEEFAGIREWLGGADAAELDHAGLEEQIAARVREVQRLLLQEHLDLRAAREQRLDEVTGPDGLPRTRAERGPSRLLATTLGQVRVTRIAYRAPGVPGVHPADAQLNLPPEKHSHGLGKLLAIEAPRGSVAQACLAVTRATGARLGTRQATALICRAAADFGDFYAGREHQPPRAAPGQVLAVSCDAKGIVVLPGQMRPIAARRARRSLPRQQGRLSRGEVATHKRMAEVGAVFDITPAPRTARDILGPGPRAPGPATTGKWVTASVADAAADVVAAVFAEAGHRDPDRQRTWIALADGNVHQLDRIRAEAQARGITITIICDYIHVLEYLWKAAWCFFPEASPHAAPWVRARARAILRGHARPVAAAIRDAITAAGPRLTPARRKQASAAAGYLDAKAPYLNYPKALAEGWPISSGVIEGACRHLVKDRMAITGARWGLDTAEAILKLCALHANGDFDAYWTYHLQRERERNHPHSSDLAAA